jgi:hypothetical protein
MRGTRLVTFGKDPVYAYIAVAGATARLRVSADEADRLDLFPGKQVALGLGNGEVSRALVTVVVPTPPFAWVELELAAAPRAAARV